MVIDPQKEERLHMSDLSSLISPALLGWHRGTEDDIHHVCKYAEL